MTIVFMRDLVEVVSIFCVSGGTYLSFLADRTTLPTDPSTNQLDQLDPRTNKGIKIKKNLGFILLAAGPMIQSLKLAFL